MSAHNVDARIHPSGFTRNYPNTDFGTSTCDLLLLYLLTFSLHTNADTQALEESLAEACQLGLESDWQREVAERLQQVDAEQDRKRERLAELHRQTLAEEERLADTMRDVAGRKVRTTRKCLSTHKLT